MDVTSLGFRTDLALLLHGGGLVEDRLGVFRGEFPDAGHARLGIDQPSSTPVCSSRSGKRDCKPTSPS